MRGGSQSVVAPVASEIDDQSELACWVKEKVNCREEERLGEVRKRKEPAMDNRSTQCFVVAIVQGNWKERQRTMTNDTR